MLRRNSVGFNGAAMRTAALIVAAGKGERAGGAVPKQFAALGGKALLCHALDSFRSHPGISAIILVVGEGQTHLARTALNGRLVDGLVTGGAERQDSVRAGLAAIASLDGVEAVLIHDAARPFLPHAVIDRLLEALETFPAAVPALPVADTLAKEEHGLGPVVDRSGLYRIQTPQAFTLDAAMTSHKAWTGTAATDDAQMARAAGYRVAMVEGDMALEKVTRPMDFQAAEQRLQAQMVSRTGMGFDVHRLEPGEELWLCGLKIPHDKGLSGHSDADVALHALVDALLGAISAGDIGSHFPPSDLRWKGAASHLFAEHARDLVTQAGGIIDHVDLTIICEAPKIGPHRDAMRACVAAMLQLPVSRVSIKATTTEGLGLTGRGEGIAAQAVATVRSRAA